MADTAKTSKLKSILGTVALATLLMGAVAAHAADLRNFWFANETGKTVAVLSVSPHESGIWYPVPNSTTRSGYRNPITFNSSFASSCFFDLNTRTGVTRPTPRAGVCATSAACGFTRTSRPRFFSSSHEDDLSWTRQCHLPGSVSIVCRELRGASADPGSLFISLACAFPALSSNVPARPCFHREK